MVKAPIIVPSEAEIAVNAEPNWNIVEHGLVGASHGCVPPRVDALMAEAGFPVNGSGFKGAHSVLLGTVSPQSTVAHLFLALWYATPKQVVDAGLDKVFALLDAVARSQDGSSLTAEAVKRRPLLNGVPRVEAEIHAKRVGCLFSKEMSDVLASRT